MHPFNSNAEISEHDLKQEEVRCDQLPGNKLSQASNERRKMTSKDCVPPPFQKVKEAVKKSVEELVGLEETSDNTHQFLSLDFEISHQSTELFQQHCDFQKGQIIPEPENCPRTIDENHILDFLDKNVEKENYVCPRNFVGVIGMAGCGKTTLAKRLTRQILSNRLSNNPDFLFYIQLRNVNFREEINLFQLLLENTSSSSCPLDLVENSEAELLEHLNNSPDVMFIFDGLDEAVWRSPNQLTPLRSTQTKATAEVFIKNILAGNLFPSAKKIFTSRPKQLFELHKACRPSFIVKILGLSKGSQRQLLEDICGSEFNKVQHYLREHPDILAFCRSPNICVVIFSSLQKLSLQGKLNSSLSFTNVMSFAIVRFVMEKYPQCAQRRIYFMKLANLAFDASQSRRMLLTQQVLQRHNVNEYDLQFFHTMPFMTYKDLTKFDGEGSFSFSHQIFQEYLTAAHIIFGMELPKFRPFLSKLGGCRWRLVGKFIYGLCNFQAQQLLKKVIHPDDVDETREKIKLLKQHAVQCTPKEISGKYSIDKFSEVVSWLREADREDFTDAFCSKHLPHVNLKEEDENLTSCQDDAISRLQQMPLDDVIHQQTGSPESWIFYEASEIYAVNDKDGCLGKGRLGHVQLAFDESHSPVAVKFTKIRIPMKEVTRFVKEALCLRRIRHPNLVQIYGYTSWHGGLAVIMEHMSGGNLKLFLENVRTEDFSPLLKYKFCGEIATGLAYLHQKFDDRRITHGDLKPPNILLTSDLQCKIADFGGALVSSTVQKDSSPHFTVAYAAPERLMNARQFATKAMDVYSFGLISYEILTQKQPFIAPMDVLAGRRPPLDGFIEQDQTQDEKIINELRMLISKCWAHYPTERPGILEIRDRILNASIFRQAGVLLMLHHKVAHITKYLKVNMPFFQRYTCVPINELANAGSPMKMML
ncbi:uncharacterized protein LOC143468481 [Clavelina lepadiformis]|uniref:uncharacterized protein LOC143468481 n=1 Tax=Clavelina lepadiformis TaxID=159417 RepID=UPI004042A56F